MKMLPTFLRHACLLALVASVASPQRVRAQRLEPSAMRAQVLPFVPSDTVKVRARVAPYLIGGAIVGGVIGALMAESYNPCSDEPSPGYSCTSTSTATGAFAGAALGVVAGWLFWAITSGAGTPTAPASSHSHH